jgi:Domain of unknown function (DUF1995)
MTRYSACIWLCVGILAICADAFVLPVGRRARGTIQVRTDDGHLTGLVRQAQLTILRAAAPAAVSTNGPPSTFIDCARQAGIAAKKAIDDGFKLIEVEFPPLPLEFLEDSSSSARDIADANTRWAMEFAQAFTDRGQVSVIYPDQAELDDAVIYMDMPGGDKPFPNVTMATIRSDTINNAKSLDQIFMSVFGATIGGTVASVPNTKLYVALVTSTQELPDLEKLHALDPDVPIVFFNLRLDILVRQNVCGVILFSCGRAELYQYLCRCAYRMIEGRFGLAFVSRARLASSFLVSDTACFHNAFSGICNFPPKTAFSSELFWCPLPVVPVALPVYS